LPLGPDRLPFQVCDLIDACEDVLPGMQNWVLPAPRERLVWRQDLQRWEVEDFAERLRVRGEFDVDNAVVLDHALATSQGYYPGLGLGSGSELPAAALYRHGPGVLAMDPILWIIGGRLELGLAGDVVAGDSVRGNGIGGFVVHGLGGGQAAALVERGSSANGVGGCVEFGDGNANPDTGLCRQAPDFLVTEDGLWLAAPASTAAARLEVGFNASVALDPDLCGTTAQPGIGFGPNDTTQDTSLCRETATRLQTGADDDFNVRGGTLYLATDTALRRSSTTKIETLADDFLARGGSSAARAPADSEDSSRIVADPVVDANGVGGCWEAGTGTAVPDVSWCRQASDYLVTADNLWLAKTADAQIQVGFNANCLLDSDLGGTLGNGGLACGANDTSARDTNLYRGQANLWHSDDLFRVVRLSTPGITCASAVEGAVYFDTDRNELCVCDDDDGSYSWDVLRTNIGTSATDCVITGTTLATLNPDGSGVIALPDGVDYFQVTNGNVIRQIGGTPWTGRLVSIYFTAGALVDNFDLGAENIYLRGNADFTFVTNDTLTLRCDGTNCSEIARLP